MPLLLKRFGLDAPASAATSPVRVMSFSARSLHRVRSASPTLPTVYLLQFISPRLRDGMMAGRCPDRRPLDADRAQLPPYIERLKRAGHQVHVWTRNPPEDVDLCVELGIDAIITNRHARCRTNSAADLAARRPETTARGADDSRRTTSTTARI